MDIPCLPQAQRCAACFHCRPADVLSLLGMDPMLHPSESLVLTLLAPECPLPRVAGLVPSVLQSSAHAPCRGALPATLAEAGLL